MKLTRKQARLIIGVASLVGTGALLATLDKKGTWLTSWRAYCLLLTLGFGVLLAAQRATRGDTRVTIAALTAFALRLVVGVGLTLALPI